MRIALMMQIASPWARAIALSLSRQGHDIQVIDFARHNRGEQYLSMNDSFQAEEISLFQREVAGIHLIESRFSSSLRYVASAGRLRRILDRCQADVLLTLYGGGFAQMAFLSGFRPYAVYAVGSDVMLARGLKKSLTRLALTKAGAVFVNGLYLSEKARELAPKAPILPLYIGIDTDGFQPTPRPPEPLRILCSRGFLPIYNNAYLIEGLARLPQGLPEFEVVFVSSGPQLEETRALADRLLSSEMRPKVRFLGGVSSAELRAELESAHLYVSLSRSDGTSTALLEALACGLFPVLSDLPQNREWIDGKNGLIVPLDEPECLAKAIIKALTDPELRKNGALHNRQQVIERANIAENMAKLARSLEELIEDNHPGKRSPQ